MFWNKKKNEKEEVSEQEQLRRKTEVTRLRKLASFLGCKQEEIENEAIAIYILSYDSLRLAITNIGESPTLHPIYWNSPIPNRLKGRLGLSEKDQFIAMYGIEAYNKKTGQIKDWKDKHPEKVESYAQKRRREGKYYSKKLIYEHTGLAGLRNRVRNKYGKMWAKYKRFVAPESRLHYEWIPDTDKCKCVALVEKDQSQYPYKDVIHIHSGETPILTTEELQAGVGDYNGR